MAFFKRLSALAVCAVLLGSPAAAQVSDHLGIPGPILFDGAAYRLAWSAQPSANYVKQEYLPAGETLETYSRMLLVERLTGVAVPAAVRAQVDMLNKRKASDPLVNMDLMQNEQAGEVLLDFIVSSADPQGQPIVEWNAYRYAPYKGPTGEQGVLLFAISRRGYGDGARAFLGNLKTLRPAQINALAAAPLPKPR